MLNAFTLAEWLSATTAIIKKNPVFITWKIHLRISWESHSPLTVTSGQALMTNGTVFLRQVIIYIIIPLSSSSSSFIPMYSPLWNCVPSWRHISSTIKTQSLERWPFSMSDFAAVIDSTPPLWIFSNKEKDNKGNFFWSNLKASLDV